MDELLVLNSHWNTYVHSFIHSFTDAFMQFLVSELVELQSYLRLLWQETLWFSDSLVFAWIIAVKPNLVSQALNQSV